MKRRISEAGFTLVEMAIVVPILILIALSLFEALFTVVQTSTQERVEMNLAYEKNVAMNEIESDIRIAPLFVPQLDTNTAGQDANEGISNPLGTGNTWYYAGGGQDKRVLILREYSTTVNPLIAGREPVFVGSGAACSDPSVATNTIQTYNTIYFVQNQTLYRRRVVDPLTKDPVCGNVQYQRTSCPTASASCPADEIIASNVTAFNVTYYSSGDPTATPLDVYTGPSPSLLASARSAQIDITQTRPAGGTNITSSISLRIATLNQVSSGS